MAAQTKRFKQEKTEVNKGRQLSSLFNIISSNLLLATEVLSSEYRIKAVEELESLSRRARLLAKELMSGSNSLNQEKQAEKISLLKHKLLALVISLIDDLGKINTTEKKNQKLIANLALARRLLRDSQRGLVTIQD